MKLLIDRDTVDATSPAFTLGDNDQVTIFAMGLNPDDRVVFELVMFGGLLNEDCTCPPLAVKPVAVQDVVPLRCCADEIVLTRDRPYVILDAPQNIPLRARLLSVDPVDQQRVWLRHTNTPNPTDYMRGCAC